MIFDHNVFISWWQFVSCSNCYTPIIVFKNVTVKFRFFKIRGEYFIDFF